MDAKQKKARTVKPIIGFRPGDLTPLIQRWVDANPKMDVTVLIHDSIRLNPEIREIAGKRYAHLLDT